MTPVSMTPGGLAVSCLRETSSNRLAFEAMQNSMALPAPTFYSRPEGVFVSVADPDDLLPWLSELGGVVHRSPVFEGVETLSLHTFTLPVAGVLVPVRVSVSVPVGESLMHEIVTAVAA